MQTILQSREEIWLQTSLSCPIKAEISRKYLLSWVCAQSPAPTSYEHSFPALWGWAVKNKRNTYHQALLFLFLGLPLASLSELFILCWSWKTSPMKTVESSQKFRPWFLALLQALHSGDACRVGHWQYHWGPFGCAQTQWVGVDFAFFHSSDVHQLCAVVLVCCSIAQKPKGKNSTEFFKTERCIWLFFFLLYL